jgi:homoserine dehydrogenase
MHAHEGEVDILRVDGAVNAEPILAALRANGIEARLLGEALGSVYGLTVDGLGEVAVLVREEDAEAARELLAAAGITRVQGIINGTTNYILTQMEAGMTYADALQEAQAKGYAEADPTGDVEGYDAAGKAVILANLLMGAELSMNDVDRTGITGLTPQDISAAAANGERWKLIGKVEKANGQVAASVRPTRLPVTHPLASVSGATNALTFTTDLLGDVTLIGPGAGRLETGYAVLGDLLAIHRHFGK